MSFGTVASSGNLSRDDCLDKGANHKRAKQAHLMFAKEKKPKIF
jgi:hypothetical protein